MSNKRLAATIVIGGAVASSLRSAFGTTRGEVDKVGQAITKLKDRQKELNNTINSQSKLGRAGSGLVAGYAISELDTVTRKLKELRTQQEKINTARNGMAAGSAMMASGGRLLGGVIAAGAIVGLPLAAASREAANFEYQLQMIGNTADMSKDDIAKLGERIKITSKATGQSVDDTVRGIGFLVAAGMDVKTATETIKQAGLAATASGGDIEDLARAAFTLNDSLKIAPGQAMALALDTLSQAGKEGNVELKDMARQLPVLGAGFVSLKMQGREAAATMGAALEVARKGAADADEAANNMKNFIAKIMSPETLKKAKKHFNLDLYKVITDAQTTGKNPFEAAMVAIMKATKGDQKKIGDLFSDMQVQNFLRPMIQNWDEYRRIKDKSLAASGVVDRDAEKIRKTQKQQVKEASNAAGRLGLAIGALLAPAVMKLANSLTPVIEKLTVFVTQHREAVVWVGKTAATILAGVGAFAAVKMGVGAVTLAFNALRLVMLTNPLGIVLTALAVGAVLIYQNWEPIKAFFLDLWSAITDGAKIAWGYIKTGFLEFGPISLVVKNWEPIREFFVGLFNDIKATCAQAIDWIMSKIEAVGQLWQDTKAFFGFGDDQSPGVARTPAAPLPAPLMATGRGGQTVNDHSQKTFQIYQQPGQSNKDLASEIDKLLTKRGQQERRGALFDPAMGY